jgi:hypothetical protein
MAWTGETNFDRVVLVKFNVGKSGWARWAVNLETGNSEREDRAHSNQHGVFELTTPIVVEELGFQPTCHSHHL